MKRSTVFALLPVLLVVPAACGEDRSPSETLSAAASATQDAGTTRISTEQISDIAGQQLTSTSEGVVDLSSGDSEATLSIELPGQPPQEVDVIATSDVAYLGAEGLPGAPPDAEWLSIDLQATGEQLGLDIEALRQNGASQLSYLTQSSDIEEVGTETVRDVDTTHYRFTTDLADLAESGPEELRSSYQSLIDLTGLETIPTEVWIDDDDLVRRLQLEVEIDQGGQQVNQTTTVEYFDFGVEVDVEAPPEEDVVDISELTGSP